jgi:hypothetical protein
VLPYSREDLSNTSCAAISAALKANSSLVMFNLPRSNLNINGMWHIAQELTLNKSVKKIVEVGVTKDVGDKALEALTAMLEKNYDLERLVVSSAATIIKQGKGRLLYASQ